MKIEANYLVVNTKMDSGRVMAIVPFETKEEAEAFMETNANELRASEEELAEADGEEYCEYIIDNDEFDGTTLLETEEGEVVCAWDIVPVADMEDSPAEKKDLRDALEDVRGQIDDVLVIDTDDGAELPASLCDALKTCESELYHYDNDDEG